MICHPPEGNRQRSRGEQVVQREATPAFAGAKPVSNAPGADWLTRRSYNRSGPVGGSYADEAIFRCTSEVFTENSTSAWLRIHASMRSW